MEHAAHGVGAGPPALRVARRPVDVPRRTVDLKDVESRIAVAARAWADDLRDALVRAHGEEEGLDLLRTWIGAFPASYQEDVPASEAVADLAVLTTLDAVDAAPLAVRLAGDADHLDLALYGLGLQPSLSEVLPRLTNMGVAVDDEHPYSITPGDRPERWIKRFRMRGPAGALPASYDLFEEAFLAASAGDTEDDAFNQLVLLAGLSWRQVALLRAYSRYLRQVGTPFSQTYIATTLAAHPDIAKFIGNFTARLDPPKPRRPPRTGSRRRSARRSMVASLDEDRILRAACYSSWPPCARTGSRRATTAAPDRASC